MMIFYYFLFHSGNLTVAKDWTVLQQIDCIHGKLIAYTVLLSHLFFFYLKNYQVQGSSDKGLSWHVRSRVNVQGRRKRPCILKWSYLPANAEKGSWMRGIYQCFYYCVFIHPVRKNESAAMIFPCICACAPFLVELDAQ